MANTQQQEPCLLNVNLSNARSENESYDAYRDRLQTNKQILKTYFTMGREAFREMFPQGIAHAMKEVQNKATNPQPVQQKNTITGSLHLSSDE